MKLKEFDILIDLKKHKQIEYIEVVAGDFGSNILNINIVEGIDTYELAGLSVEIAFAKPDGTTVLQDMYNGIELIGNKIKCTLKTNTIASPGKVLAEIRILEGVKLLTTARFSFYVRKPIVDNDTVESTNEYPILGQLIEDVNVLIDDIESKPEIRGYSAYQIWINEGNTGTVDDYLGSLIGPPGPEGPKGPTGSITNLDKGNIEDALGYTPTKSINDILPDAAGNIAVELASDIEVINNLTETVAGKALDATKGKFLKDELDTHKADYANFKNNIEAVKYEGDKLFLKVNGEWVEFKRGGQYPVGNVSGIKTDEDDMQVTINWIDPPDLTIEDSLGNLITLSKWAGTQLRRKKLSYPSSENDGELIVDSKIREQYKVNGYVDSGLVNDEEYFYMLFPYTEDGVFTVDSANRISATPTEINPDTWSGIQKIVRQGLASEFFEVGDEIVTEYDDGEIIWQVIGIDIDTPADPELTHSLTLQTKDCLHDIQFDAPEPSNPDSNRRSYGNNRYLHSAVRQWLNSDESTFIWQSQHQYDAKPTGSLDLYNGAGFLNRLDPELVAVLGNVKKKVAKNTVTDGGGQEEFTDKVFLLSQLEVDLGTEGTATGGFIYPFYQGKGNANRIKNLNYSPRLWWLRSPHVSGSGDVRDVHTSGALGNRTANSSYGLSPACTIC